MPADGHRGRPEVQQLQRLPAQPAGQDYVADGAAQSCNTAFIGQRGKLDQSSLAEAAGSLGFGIDYDVGFSSYFGSVPNDPTATGRAAAMIGQGRSRPRR